MRTNLLIATWSGSRYNPSKDYLKVLVKRLFELKHSLDQITIIIPKGSWNQEYYDIESLVPEDFKYKVQFLHRPDNDRSYGQFIYAYQQYTDQFTHYIILEDDYIPNIDNFDNILVDMIESKGVDYLCGKYAKQCKQDRDRAIMNQGIVKSESFKKLLEHTPNPKYPVMGPEDGTEQLIFSEHFTNAGMKIGEYADDYPVPYWAKTLMYFSDKRGFDTLFVPYQCIALNKDSHFLSTIKYSNIREKDFSYVKEIDNIYLFKNIDRDYYIIQEPQIDLYPHNGLEIKLGLFRLYRKNNLLFLDCFIHPDNFDKNIDLVIYERLSWENRSENLHISINQNNPVLNKLLRLKWEIKEKAEEENYIILYKDYRNW